jgi:cytochrome c oxidase cbb3-type subunit I
MSEISPPLQTRPANPGGEVCPQAAPAAIDASCRLPLVVIFLCAAVWLVIGSAFTLIASIKFHAPGFLADSAWLTYGRVHPAALNCMLYGFCMPAGLGVALWLLARLGRTTLALPGLVMAGAVCWNLGVAAGIGGILTGGTTGFENLEMPAYAARLVFLGYLMIVVLAVLTFHQRRERQLFVSQWFLFAALFWFPWIYSTADLLLLTFRVRGMAQAVIAWWYSDNLQVVWLGLVGLAAVFYFMPKLTARELHSRYLALLTFWMLMLFGSWGGISRSAPVPAWMPVSSAVATGLGIVTIIAVALNVHATLGGQCSRLLAHPSLRFIGFGVVAFVAGGLMSAAGALSEVSRVTDFTWFTAARGALNSYGFFAMVIFGAVYYILPQLMGTEFPFAKLVRAHFWTAAAGVLLLVVPLAAGGIVQGLKLQQPTIPFTDIAHGTLPFLRASTMGDLLIALGHLMFLANLTGLVIRFYRARAVSAWASATAEIKPVEARA